MSGETLQDLIAEQKVLTRWINHSSIFYHQDSYRALSERLDVIQNQIQKQTPETQAQATPETVRGFLTEKGLVRARRGYREENPEEMAKAQANPAKE